MNLKHFHYYISELLYYFAVEHLSKLLITDTQVIQRVMHDIPRFIP